MTRARHPWTPEATATLKRMAAPRATASVRKSNFEIAAEKTAEQEARYASLYGDAASDAQILRQRGYTVTTSSAGFLVDGRPKSREEMRSLADRERRLQGAAPPSVVARISGRTLPSIITAGGQMADTDAMNPIVRTSTGLREALFDQIDRLRSGKSTVNEAKAVAMLAKSIVDTVHMEIAVAHTRKNQPDDAPLILPPALKLDAPQD